MLAALLLAAAALSPLDAAIHASVAPCPPPDKGEITVCGRREVPGERSRYLSPIPSEYEVGDPRAQSVSAERNGLFDYDAGGSGTCSAVGLTGAMGCGFQKHNRWALQKAGAADGRGPLFAK